MGTPAPAAARTPVLVVGVIHRMTSTQTRETLEREAGPGILVMERLSLC